MKTSTTPIDGNSCDEKLVKISGDKLTATSGNGEEHSYTVAKEAKVTCDGKAAKLSELKSGSTIRMTLCKDNRYKILAIDTGKHVHAATPA